MVVERPARAAYVYAICATSTRPSPATLRGLPTDHLLTDLRAVPLSGPRTLVVADVPAEHFGGGPDLAPKDVEWAARCAAAHHAVVQRLADRRGATVVPLRPFTLFPDPAAAAAALTARRRTLDQAFRRVRGRREWVVRVARPPGQPEGRQSPKGLPAQGASGALSSGTAFLESRGRQRRAAVDHDRRVREGVERLAAGLDKVSAHVVLRAIEPGSGLVLDAACLVPSAGTRRLQRDVERLSASLREDDYRVTVTGPWPAYSFVTLADEDDG